MIWTETPGCRPRYDQTAETPCSASPRCFTQRKQNAHEEKNTWTLQNLHLIEMTNCINVKTLTGTGLSVESSVLLRGGSTAKKTVGPDQNQTTSQNLVLTLLSPSAVSQKLVYWLQHRWQCNTEQITAALPGN